MSQTTQEKIKPQLRVFDLTMIVAGLVIGMGIFQVPSVVAQRAQMPSLFFLAWILGAVVSFMGALTFAEIGSRYPVAGGFYKIFSHCYHPAFAFMVNWIVVISNAGATAAVAMMGAEYIAPVLFPGVAHDKAIMGIALTATVVLYAVNMTGIKVSARLLNGLMIIKLSMLLLLIVAIFAVKGTPAPQAAAAPMTGPDMFRAFALCFIPVFFSYGGYQQTMNFGSDIPDASRNMPRAIFYGISIVLAVYLLVNYSYYKTLGMQGLASSTTIAADITGLMLGSFAHKLVSVIMFFCVMAYVNVSIMVNPRIYFAMAEDKVLPPIFKRLNSKTQVQEFALTLFCTFIVLTVFFISSFQKVLDQVMFFDSISLVAAAAAIFVLRSKARKEGTKKGVFKMRGYPVVPVIFIIVYCSIIASVFYANRLAAISGFVLFVSGWPLYYVIRHVIALRDKRNPERTD